MLVGLCALVSAATPPASFSSRCTAPILGSSVLLGLAPIDSSTRLQLAFMSALPISSLSGAAAAAAPLATVSTASDLFLAQARSVATGDDLPTTTTIRTRGAVTRVADRQQVSYGYSSNSFSTSSNELRLGAQLEQLFGGRGLPEAQKLLARSDWATHPSDSYSKVQSIYVLAATPSVCLSVDGHKTKAAHVEKDSNWHLHASDAGGFTYRAQLNPATNLALSFTSLDPDSCGIVQHYLGESVADTVAKAASRVLLPFRSDPVDYQSGQVHYECVAGDTQLRQIGWRHHSLYDELRARSIADIRAKLRLQWMADHGRMRNVVDEELHTTVRAFKTKCYKGVTGVSVFPIGDVEVEVRLVGSDQSYKLPFVYTSGSMRVLSPSLAVTPRTGTPGPFILHLSFGLQLDSDGLVSIVRAVASQSTLAELDQQTRSVYSRLV